jgi:hypothetical protein
MGKEGAMQAMRWAVVVGLVCAVSAVASDPTIPYQGRITVSGAGYTGQGYFKFTLNDGQTGRWSNVSNQQLDPTVEPSAAVSAEVNNGLFSIELGDTNIPNMTNIPATAFHRQLLWLRTWFSTNNVTFEQLAGDALLRPTDFGKINTGNAYVVDDDGAGDFREIQDAVDGLVGGGGTVLVMPGYYNVPAPISVVGGNPGTPNITIQGVGRPIIENAAGGAAVTAWPNLIIDGVQLRGSPAIACPPSGDWRQLELRECEFVANRPETDAALFQGTCSVDIVDCEFRSDSPTTTCMRVTGRTGIGARDCDFSSWQQDSSAVVLDGAVDNVNFSHCVFSSEDPQGLYALKLVGTEEDKYGEFSFKDCSFHGPVKGDGRFPNTWFRRSWFYSDKATVPAVRFVGGHDFFVSFRECELHGGDAVPVLVLTDGTNRNFMVRDTTFYSRQARAIDVRNEWSGIRLENCDVTANSSEAIWIEAPAVGVTPVRNPAIEVWRSTVEAWGMGEPHTAMVITGAQENVQNYGGSVAPWAEVKWSSVRGNGDGLAGWWSRLLLRDSEVGRCQGAGVRIQGGEVTFSGTHVDADGEGVVAITSEVDIEDGSAVSGGSVGVHMQDGELGVSGSEISANDKAIVIAGVASLGVVNSEISADDEDAGTGTGISANFASTQNEAHVIGSLVYGMVAGMDLQTGVFTIANCTLASETTVTVLRDPANITTFDGCRMLGLSKESTAPIVNLVGNAGAFPRPKILGCSLRSVSTNAYSAVDTTGPGTAQIIMNLTTLSTNISANVDNSAAPTVDAKGNVIVP